MTDFGRHLHHASRIVATWPQWKRQLLGRTVAQAPKQARITMEQIKAMRDLLDWYDTLNAARERLLLQRKNAQRWKWSEARIARLDAAIQEVDRQLDALHV